VSYDILNPESLETPRGFNHGLLASPESRILFVAGQTARRSDGQLAADGFVGQFGAALDAVLTVVQAAGGAPRHIGRLTIYVTDMEAYRGSLESLGEAYRARMGRHYPAMTLIEVGSLVDPEAMVEIEATAALPATADGAID
jgi:enamine deaminase RidA (YjgF/YER057c/UK114 family)